VAQISVTSVFQVRHVSQEIRLQYGSKLKASELRTDWSHSFRLDPFTTGTEGLPGQFCISNGKEKVALRFSLSFQLEANTRKNILFFRIAVYLETWLCI
jgi:hypothetical protein